MKRRIHRFERILRTREVERDEVQRELSRRLEREREAEGTLDALARERGSAMGAFCGAGERTLSLRELWLERMGLDHLEAQVKAAERGLAEARASVLTAREHLVEKHRDVRILELYVEKLRKGLVQIELASEQAFLDDLAGQRNRERGGVPS
jgi:flagellar export protein FliJ